MVPKIGLCMIMKNETHIVKECLDSIAPFISTYVIVDTGSTDGSQKYVRKIMDGHGITGTVYDRPWRGFGPSRTESLELCKGKMDYAFCMDCDDYVSGSINWKEVFANGQQPSAFRVLIKHGAMQQRRHHLFKVSDGWKYRGVIHEFPECPNRGTIVDLPDTLWINARTMGDRSKDPQKYQKDAETLLNEIHRLEKLCTFPKGTTLTPQQEQEIRDHRGMIARYTFYLAQSYRDCGKPDNSIKWYTKRLDLGGFYEEIYISTVRILQQEVSKFYKNKMIEKKDKSGKMSIRTEQNLPTERDFRNLVEWVWRGCQVCPKRGEGILTYLVFCSTFDHFTPETYAMSLYGRQLGVPEREVLFIEMPCYRYLLKFQCQVHSLYTKNYQDAIDIGQELLENPDLPTNYRNMVNTNIGVARNRLGGHITAEKLPDYLFYPGLDVQGEDIEQYQGDKISSRMNEVHGEAVNTTGWIKKSWGQVSHWTTDPKKGIFRRAPTNSKELVAIIHQFDDRCTETLAHLNPMWEYRRHSIPDGDRQESMKKIVESEGGVFIDSDEPRTTEILPCVLNCQAVGEYLPNSTELNPEIYGGENGFIFPPKTF